MTGTAMTEAAEFDQIYKLGVVPIPTNRPMVRDDQADLDLPHRGRQVRGGRRRHRRAAREGPAGPRRHHQRREVRVPLAALLRKRGVPHEVLNAKQHDAGGGDRRPGRPQGRRHRGHEHGRPRHRHHARRQPRVHGRRPSCASAGSTPVEHAEEYEAAWPGALEKAEAGGQGRARGGHRARRPLRPGHRAARVAPHRQPAAWSVRPSGRPGRVAGSTCRSATT